MKIMGYDVRRVMIDQSSGAEVMYPDLFKGLRLKPKDLDQYDASLIRFDRNSIVPKGRIRLLILTGDGMVSVDFIVVDAFSSYTAILARPWLHVMGAVASSLHVKVKCPTNGRVAELVGCQSTTRQCMVEKVNHHITELSSSKVVPTL